LQFDVIDTGIGMSEEQLGQLFQSFSQADSSTTRRFGGTGLGLAISRRLAEFLGGTISVTSGLGEGSTFRLTIAARSADKQPEGVGSGQGPIQHSVVPSLGPGAQPLAGCRLLLAEDSPDNQRLISHVLRKAGAEVAVADNGQVACDAILGARDAGRSFDVVLMDMQMPVLDGYEAVDRLRQAGYNRPIIALTAHSMGSDRKKCLDAGCDEFDTKPINRTRLITLIGTCLGRPSLPAKTPAPGH
jgi:CheY-like chemotaxis protein